MQENKVMLFMATNGSKFSESKKGFIIDRLRQMPDENFMVIQTMEFKKPTTWLIMYLFVPFFAFIDRIILGEIGLGILKLITGGGLFIWMFIDIFTISSRVKEQNYKKMEPFLLM